MSKVPNNVKSAKMLKMPILPKLLKVPNVPKMQKLPEVPIVLKAPKVPIMPKVPILKTGINAEVSKVPKVPK